MKTRYDRATKRVVRVLDQFEREERDRRFAQLHYVHGISLRAIADLHDREQAEIVKNGGIPEPGIKRSALSESLRKVLRKTATEVTLQLREDEVVARLRYEHLFRHLLQIAKRTGADKVSDQDSVAAARAAALVQTQIDRLSNAKPSHKHQVLKDQKDRGYDPVSLGKKIAKAFAYNPEHQNRIRDAMSMVKKNV
jgi:hypothetical protein